MKLLIVFGWFIVSPALQIVSADDNTARVCDDLFKFTCAPGNYDDGTGTARRLGSEETLPLFGKLRRQSHNLFRKELAKPDASYFRKIVLSATGLTAAPACGVVDNTPSDECLDLMAEGASELQIRFLSVGAPQLGDSDYKMGKVKDVHFLLGTDEYKGISEKLIADARDFAQSQAVEKKIENEVFPSIKEMLAKRVSELVVNPEVRKKLVAKILAIKFKGQDCSTDVTEQKTISAVLLANAFYNPLQNSFRYCSGINVSSTSAFTQAFVIAHEIAHSVDPCNVAVGPSDFSFNYPPNLSAKEAERKFPIGNFLSCLRKKNSVGAVASVIRPPFSADSGGSGYGTMGYEYPKAPSSEPTGPKFDSFCANDQIGESFCDWLAMEVVPEYIAKKFPQLTQTQRRLGYSNMFRLMCGNDAPFGFDVHPAIEDRVNGLALVQPQIRRQMGCSESPSNRIYCPAEGLVEEGVPDGPQPSNPTPIFFRRGPLSSPPGSGRPNTPIPSGVDR